MPFRSILILAATLAAVSALPSPAQARSERPNIVVIVTDDQRDAGTLQAMPKTRRHLVREGRRFALAFANNPLCCPARSTLLSGLYSHNHAIASNDPLTEPLRTDRMVQSVLRRAGYRTALIGKFLNNWPVDRNPTGFHDWWMHEGGYTNSRWNVNGRVGTVRPYATTYANRRIRSFVRRQERRRRPFFLYVAPFAPHGPVEVEGRHRNARVGPHPDTPSMRAGLEGHPPAMQDPRLRIDDPDFGVRLRSDQLRALRSVDDLVGDLIRSLRDTDQDRDTLVIYTSDQGLFWGERGGMLIKDLPYDEATRIPMLLRRPGKVRRGSRDRRLVGHVDVAPTILDAAGARAPWPMDGRSLLRRWSRDRILLEYGGLRNLLPRWAAVRTRTAQYTEWYDVPGWREESLPRPGSEPTWRELFDLHADPHQLRNLIPPEARGDPAMEAPSPAATLADRLHSDLGCAGSDCP